MTTINLNDIDKPEVKNIFVAKLAERLVSTVEGKGLTKTDDFVLVPRPFMSCVSQLIIIDEANPDFTLNIKAKAVDCSVIVSLVEKKTGEHVIVRDTGSLRFKIGDEAYEPTVNSEESVQRVMEDVKGILDKMANQTVSLDDYREAAPKGTSNGDSKA